jgi:SAM-dependent methyltransferase
LAGARRTADFGPIADSYDRLRPVDGRWWEVFDRLVAEGDLIGRRVLDLGCGTGRVAGALAERGGKVWGVDPSPEMLAQARANHPRPLFKEGRAEALPFKDSWFERVVVRLALHHMDRLHALPEIARVLAPEGRIVAATFDPPHFGDYWLTRLFPSIEAIDRERFPDGATLTRELEGAGFGAVRITRLAQDAAVSREDALERIRGRYVSTLLLLDDAEYERGLACAERALPERIDYRLEWLIVAAELPPLDAVRRDG